MARTKQDTEAVLDPANTDSEMSTEIATEAIAAKSAKTKVSGERKVGPDLLSFVQENQGMPGDELAFNAGYYTTTTDTETGETQTRIHKNEFFKAVTEASSGIVISSARRAYSGRRNRATIVTVGKVGNCVVGARHSAIAGFAPGSKVKNTTASPCVTDTPTGAPWAAAPSRIRQPKAQAAS